MPCLVCRRWHFPFLGCQSELCKMQVEHAPVLLQLTLASHSQWEVKANVLHGAYKRTLYASDCLSKASQVSVPYYQVKDISAHTALRCLTPCWWTCAWNLLPHPPCLSSVVSKGSWGHVAWQQYCLQCHGLASFSSRVNLESPQKWVTSCSDFPGYPATLLSGMVIFLPRNPCWNLLPTKSKWNSSNSNALCCIHKET